MPKQKDKTRFRDRFRRTATVSIALIMFVAGPASTEIWHAMAATCTSSSDCQQQIDTLNSQNSQDQQALTGLQAQAGSYQDAIDKLQSQIDILQQQISSNQTQQDQVQQQIAATQVQLDQERNVLGEDIHAMYVGGQITTLEMLASSKDLSDFVDKQQYQATVQDKIKSEVDQISSLKNQLQDKQQQIATLITSLQDQQSQLATAQSQQNQLLSYNQSQQDQYNQQIQANKSALAQLYAIQSAIIVASFGGSIHYGGTGNYPYASAVCLNSSGNCSGSSESPYNWGYPPNSPYDPAGWQYRNCTSYAFWRLAQTTGITLTWASFPTVYNSGGRIGQSLPDFRNLGYRVDQDPTGAAVLAVNTAGNFGHIMYVEGVVNGDAVVSQYNAAGDGLYSTGTLSPSSSIWFVHIR